MTPSKKLTILFCKSLHSYFWLVSGCQEEGVVICDRLTIATRAESFSIDFVFICVCVCVGVCVYVCVCVYVYTHMLSPHFSSFLIIFSLNVQVVSPLDGGEAEFLSFKFS